MVQQTEEQRPRPGGGSVRPRAEAGAGGCCVQEQVESPSPAPVPCPDPRTLQDPPYHQVARPWQWGGALCLAPLAPHLGNLLPPPLYRALAWTSPSSSSGPMKGRGNKKLWAGNRVPWF